MDNAARPRRDLAALLRAALDAGCPVAPGTEVTGNPAVPRNPVPDQGLAPLVAPVALVAPAPGEVGAEDVAAGGVDPLEAAERAAITAEPPLPPPGSPARTRLDCRQRMILAGLLAVARCRNG